MNWTFFLIALAVLIVLALALVAAVLQYRVYQQNKARAVRLDQQAQEQRAQRERVNKSIQVIASSVHSDDITLTEASIRIRVLLDSLGVPDSVREEFAAFYELAEATEHIPILDDWKALPTKKKLAFDRERVTQEQFFEKRVLEAAKRIRGRLF